MKSIANGKLVPALSFYFLLDRNEQNERKYINETFNKNMLCELTLPEYTKLFMYASLDITNHLMDIK